MWFVLVPKTVAALALFWLGGQYLAVSNSNEDLLLNTLALEFILNLAGRADNAWVIFSLHGATPPL